jgi:hypothetical protein
MAVIGEQLPFLSFDGIVGRFFKKRQACNRTVQDVVDQAARGMSSLSGHELDHGS